MAFHSPLTASWNPLRITGTPMPAALLLLCKVLALAILATGHWRILPEPFLPFIPALEVFDPRVFRITLQVTVWGFALSLLFNRAVRLTALGLGMCMLLAVIASRAYYGNNKTFVGLLLVLAGLSDFGRPAYLLRWQFSLVYFGAALNKLLDPDWQSGLFFEYWASEKIRDPIFLIVRHQLPPLLAGKIMCWGTIGAEFAIAFLLFLPQWVPLALWINALFQIGLLQFTGGTFTLFFFAMQASALAFLAWPTRMNVAYPRDSWMVCLRRLDFDSIQQWRLTVPPERFQVEEGQVRFAGICGTMRLVLRSPTFWLAATFALAMLPSDARVSRRLVVATIFVLILPGFFGKGCKERKGDLWDKLPD